MVYSFSEPLSSEDRESEQSDSLLPQKVTKTFYKAGPSTANGLLVPNPSRISNPPGGDFHALLKCACQNPRGRRAHPTQPAV